MAIQAAPEITTSDLQDNIVIKVGGYVSIDVPFTAHPQPKVKWTYNGKSLPSTRRINSDILKNTTALSIAKVEIEDSGKYAVNLENDYGSCNYKVQISAIDKPGPPQQLKVKKIGETTIDLEWNNPKNDGGSPVTEFVVEKRDSYRRGYTEVCTTKSKFASIKNLTEGNEYIFRVSAKNSVGVGDGVELDEGVKPKSPHGTSEILFF